MFGTIKPRLCRQGTASAETYRAAHCGLCKALAVAHGPLARVLATHDLTTLAVLADAVAVVPAEMATCRCPLAPGRQQLVLAPSAAAMRLAAATQVILADLWLADQAADRSRLFGAARWLLTRAVRRSRAALLRLGFRDAAWVAITAQQAAVEGVPATPERAAAPTGQMVASLLEQVGVAAIGTRSAAVSPLPEQFRRLGEALGHAVYLIDSIRDLRSDCRRRQFNPCLETVAGRTAPSPARFDATVSALVTAVAGVREQVSAISWPRHGALVRHLLVERLAAVARQSEQATRRWLDGNSPSLENAGFLAWLGAAFRWLRARVTAKGRGDNTEAMASSETSDSSAEQEPRPRHAERGDRSSCCQYCDCEPSCCDWGCGKDGHCCRSTHGCGHCDSCHSCDGGHGCDSCHACDCDCCACCDCSP
ncbi:MAG: hypothetical protein HYV63_31640 [Candidatus Schekmanbacteria bacterium]|nr:hypothetical protein [Candidatus Schekmanbacteria bacterium]